jgi:uncharacterized SAM-binding protein YcdF (DUF218 family)
MGYGRLRIALTVVGVLVGLVLAYLALTAIQIWLTSLQYDAQDAGAIVVMGAAQYNGVPSPDFRSRLNEALTLYRQGYAHLIVVTGSKQPGDEYTEAESGSRYLAAKGVPRADVLEAGGSDSYENLIDAAPELRAHHVTRVLIATDPFHEYRSMAIASSFGFKPHPTPTRNSPIRGWATVPYYVRETVGVALARIIGYRDVSRLRADIG